MVRIRRLFTLGNIPPGLWFLWWLWHLFQASRETWDGIGLVMNSIEQISSFLAGPGGFVLALVWVTAVACDLPRVVLGLIRPQNSEPVVLDSTSGPQFTQEVLAALDRQRTGLGDCLVIKAARVDPTGIDDTAPYIDFNLTFKNFSCFTLVVYPIITGYVKYQHKGVRSTGRVLEFERPRIGPENQIVYPPNDESSVTLRQYLNTGTRDELKQLHEEEGEVSFDFSDVVIKVGATDDGTKARHRLPFDDLTWLR